MSLTATVDRTDLEAATASAVVDRAARRNLIWVLEETSSHMRRQTPATGAHGPIAIRLYSIDGRWPRLVDETVYESGTLVAEKQNRAALAAGLLRRAAVEANGTVVASYRVGGLAALLRELSALNLEYVIEVPAKATLRIGLGEAGGATTPLSEAISTAKWAPVDLQATHSNAQYFAALIGPVIIEGAPALTCYALSTGGIGSYQRGLLVAVTSLNADTPLPTLARHLAWSRWIAPYSRRAGRDQDGEEGPARPAGRLSSSVILPIRANQQIARRFDEKEAASWAADSGPGELRGHLGRSAPIKLVELFAGAGGMGLGFLMADARSRYRLVHSAEIHPTYVRTLQVNHKHAAAVGICPADAVPSDDPCPQDLRSALVADEIVERAEAAGGADILIGGPPCQGFSNANRNSWSSSNPNNRLVDTFLDYVGRLNPKALLMENVQGILWTAKHDHSGGDLSVAAHVLERLRRMGYEIHPKLVDAAWYGAPQHRNRFFLLGIHRDLGYKSADFGRWGPFPRPMFGPGTDRRYVTVRDAISDLPEIGNGAVAEEVPYEGSKAPGSWFLAHVRRGAPEGVIWDHVTSRHAPYVIDRYHRIRPGGNWEDVADMMTNYADVDRTHSNIYRRLSWDDPAVTIGHYRKSMIVHPEQHRGLSLREAARLQSFPDWFRFAGSPSRVGGGLTHKQQQLANAVCPLVTKAVAEYLLNL